MAGRIQKEDVKTLAELTGAGGSASQLINDTQIYVSANSLNKQLSAAVTDRDLVAVMVGDSGSGGTKGLVPAPGAGDAAASKFLKADGTWATTGGGGGGGIAANGLRSVKTANYTIVGGDDKYVIPCNSSGGSFDVTLPTPSSNFLITIKDVTGSAQLNNVVIKRAGSEKIDNATTDDSIRENYGSMTLISDGTDWYRIHDFNGSSPFSGARAIFHGGGGGFFNVLEYVNPSSAGNAADFGDLTQVRRHAGATSSQTRGVFAGGLTTGTTEVNTIDYIAVASLGDATDFGDLVNARGVHYGAGSITRGVFGGGTSSSESVYTNTGIDYFEIATIGNATSFGSLSVGRSYSGSTSSTTRTLWAGGYTASNSNVIDYVTTATTGNATDFGDILSASYGCTGASSNTRGIFALGYIAASSNTIEYVTIASTGNSTDFGDLTQARNDAAGASNKTRALFAGGFNDGLGSGVNTIDYITIASTGNATDFGDLVTAMYNRQGLCNAHGGI